MSDAPVEQYVNKVRDWMKPEHGREQVVKYLRDQDLAIEALTAENAQLKRYGHRNCTIDNCEFDGTECWTWRHQWPVAQQENTSEPG